MFRRRKKPPKPPPMWEWSGLPPVFWYECECGHESDSYPTAEQAETAAATHRYLTGHQTTAFPKRTR